MRLGIDLMGGDYAPHLPQKMVSQISQKREFDDHEIHCFASQDILDKTCNKKNLIPHTCSTFIPASLKNPREVLKQPESSIFKGIEALQRGYIDTFISAGNTGAIVVAAKVMIPAKDGISRPCLAIRVPKIDGNFGLLVDVGANAEVKHEHLTQFANLGLEFASKSLGILQPKLGLINIGSEPTKGDKLRVESYKNFQDQFDHFVGNVEGWEIFTNKADVMVCDGFTGNVILKLSEGFAHIILKQDVTNPFLSQFKMENHGGSFLLGFQKPIVIGHGSSNQATLENMLKLALKM